MKKGKVVSLSENTGLWFKSKDQTFKKGLNFMAIRDAKSGEKVVMMEVINVE